jgi:hypothetical protein
MPNLLLHEEHDDGSLHKESFFQNPLVHSIRGVLEKITDFKEKARSFYFEVILSQHQCPLCHGKLNMTGQSQCTCSCGNVFDPTLTFQKSRCCGAGLLRRTFHYVCSRCRKVVPSRFLFDERLFDRAYFKEMMRESRERAKRKKEEVRRLLAESRSGILPLMDEPNLDSIPGLVQALDEFIQKDSGEEYQFSINSEFRMNNYRDHILSVLTWNSIQFSDITPFAEDVRQDKVWRFVTLIFMQNDNEVELTQDGDDLWVQRIYNETNA